MLTTRASAAGFRASKSSIRRSEDAGAAPLLSPPHRRCRAGLPDRVVVPEDVQSAMHHESEHLFSWRDSLPLRVLASDLWTNVDVSNHRTTFARPPKAERDYVSRPAVP